MSRREEMLAVISERDAQVARYIATADRLWWRPLLGRWLRGEARRLIALNQRDLGQLPPVRHRPAGDIQRSPRG